MSNILSVFFSSERVYLTFSRLSSKGLKLLNLNSTEFPIDLEDISSDNSTHAAQELEILISGLPEKIDRVTATISAENALVSQIPGDGSIAESDLKNLIRLEINQAFPTLNFNDFSANIYPLAPKKDGSKRMIAVIIPKKIFKSAKQVLKPCGRSIDNIEISQINAQNAFIFNYPELIEAPVALLGVDRQFVDISVVKDSAPVYYNLVRLPGASKLGEICKTEFEKILKDYAANIQSAYFFGPGLSKKILDQAQKEVAGLVMQSGRLNAFRMVSTELDDRDKQYCSRLLHIFPPCIGGSMTSYSERIKLF